jgi:hypothetical protein
MQTYYSLFKFDEPKPIRVSKHLFQVGNNVIGSGIFKICKHANGEKIGESIWTSRKGINSTNITADEKVELQRLKAANYKTELEHPNPDAPYEAAEALWRVFTYTNNGRIDFESLFVLQSPWVKNAGLMVLAKYRDYSLMETLISLGANVHDTRNGYSILELALTGIGYDERNKVKEMVECVKILSKNGVTASDITHDDVKEYCKEYAKKSAYMRKFLTAV